MSRPDALRQDRKVFDTSDKLFRSPGRQRKDAKIGDDFLAKPSNIVLISDNEDIQAEDSIFLGLGGICDLLGVRQVVDVTHHGMNGFGMVIVSKVNLAASRDLSKVSVSPFVESNLGNTLGEDW